MNAAFRLRMSAGERRAMGMVSLLAGGFYAASSVVITVAMVAWAALDPDFEYVDPLWAWAAVTIGLAAATTALGIDAARRGLHATQQPEVAVHYAVALCFATVVWLVWATAANVYFLGLSMIVVGLGAAGALAGFVLGRLWAGMRAVLDSRR